MKLCVIATITKFHKENIEFTKEKISPFKNPVVVEVLQQSDFLGLNQIQLGLLIVQNNNALKPDVQKFVAFAYLAFKNWAVMTHLNMIYLIVYQLLALFFYNSARNCCDLF